MKNKQDIFCECYLPLKDKLWRFCMSVCKDYEEAKDLLQETILKSYENFGKIKNNQAFLSYLFSVASHLNLNNAIKNKEKCKNERMFDDSLISQTPQPDALLEYQDVHRALSELPAEQCEAIVLFNIMGFSREEICKIQNISMEALKRRLYRGRKKLAEILKRDDVIISKETP
jgi:RNA polymerase sigma-70 factor, ECF subfamily